MGYAFVFPGQGAQVVGMGAALAEAFPCAREVFQEVDDALEQHLFRLMVEGPEADLTLTENTQPALMAVSMAVVRVLQAEGGVSLARVGRYVAGHSLGEYSALCAAGALTLADCARLLRLRGRAMQAAVPVGEGAMAAILGLDFDAVDAIAKQAAQDEVCAAANDNAPGQVVVSGHAAAVERAIALAKEQGAKRAVLLTVSAPFHCRLMAPAADAMAEALAVAAISPPDPALVANVTARPVEDPAEIRELLVRQVTGAVRWRETIEFLRDRQIEAIVELGVGGVLTGLTKRIDRDLNGRAVSTPGDIEALIADLG
ncbi:MAG: ACP S-malonyltransferase [Alphaproteobacteria bacterium]